MERASVEEIERMSVHQEEGRFTGKINDGILWKEKIHIHCTERIRGGQEELMCKGGGNECSTSSRVEDLVFLRELESMSHAWQIRVSRRVSREMKI